MKLYIQTLRIVLSHLQCDSIGYYYQPLYNFLTLPSASQLFFFTASQYIFIIFLKYFHHVPLAEVCLKILPSLMPSWVVTFIFYPPEVHLYFSFHFKHSMVERWEEWGKKEACLTFHRPSSPSDLVSNPSSV